MVAVPLRREVAPRRSGTPTIAPRRRGRTASAAKKPSLVVVSRRRRWPAFVAVLAWSMVFVAMLGAAVFHTQLAGRQLRIDRLERSVAAERERFDELRYERAELRSPVRLAAAASALGMERGDVSEFISVSPETIAQQIAAAGAIDDPIVQITIDTDPLDQFRSVKQVTQLLP